MCFNELETEAFSSFLEASDAPLFASFAHFACDFIVVGCSGGDQFVDDPDQLVGSRGNSLGLAKLRFHSPAVLPQFTLASPQRHRTHSQLISQTAFHSPRFGAEGLVPGDSVVRA